MYITNQSWFSRKLAMSATQNGILANMLPNDLVKIINAYAIKPSNISVPTFQHTCKQHRRHIRSCSCLHKFVKVHRIKCLTPYIKN